MLRSLTLKHFRSYKEAYLEFSQGVNAIIGTNDSGKTNIVRSIQLVTNNRPSGEKYRAKSGGDTLVMLEADEKLISRDRTKKANTYSITNADVTEDVFKAFGKGVPEAVTKHLNMTDVNVHLQLDGPFLLNKSAPDVARYFNNIVNLDVIDSTISNISKMLRKEKSELAFETNKGDELAESLKDYDWLAGADLELVKLEKLEQAIIGMKSDWSSLYAMTEELERLNMIDESLDKIISNEAKIKVLEEQDAEISSLMDDCQELIELIESRELLTELSNSLDKIANPDNIKLIDDLLNLGEKIEKEKQLHLELSSLIEQRVNLGIEFSEWESREKALEIDFKNILPDACPIFDVQCDHIDSKKKND